MMDSYGRNIDYLRISVTDRCNLRCVYCMPKTGVEQVDHSLILSHEEILMVCEVMAGLGISKIKITGGEPLVRRHLPEIIRDIKKVPGISCVTMTTNGVALAGQMEALVKAGLDGLNISLDALDPLTYKKITRRDAFTETMAGIKKALEFPQIALKINCVPLGKEGQDLCQMAKLAKDHPVHVRFIEMMPIGLGEQFTCMPEDEIRTLLEAQFGPLVPYEGVLGPGPGHYVTVEGFQGKIGFISAISHKFCTSCNRIRLTSQGYLKTCLQYAAGCDLRQILRSGKSKEAQRRALEAAILQAVAEKPVSHAFRTPKGLDQTETMCMSQIGG
ncbi:MAG: GTP 3',8-cyclase MoaA [Blautia sp.]|jgi:cyclic pyranopterin phosphate synthase